MDSPVTKPWHSANFCNIAGALRWQADRQPGAIAVHYADFRYYGPQRYSSCTYLEFNELTDAYARGLRAFGVNLGDRVVLMAEHGFAFIALFHALLRSGAIPVVTDPGMPARLLGHCISDAEPHAFIGSPRANLTRLVRGWGRKSCQRALSTGRGVPGVAIGIKALYKLGMSDTREMFHHSKPDDLAAILYTSGRDGEPKGVVYRHRHLSAQVDLFKEAFDINPGEVSLPTSPMFGILDPALGLTTVIAKVNPNRPTQAAAKRLLDAVEKFRVNNIFLSPSMLETLSRHIEKNGIRLPIIRRLITFGASPRLEIIARLEKALHDEARIHAPYGSAECFPVSSVTNHEVDSTLEDMMESGEGVCLGRPVEPNEVKIIAPSDSGFRNLEEVTELPPGMPGEIIVCGPSCTDSYWRRDDETERSRIPDGSGRLWHRMGDVASIDGLGRLWFCGQMSQRVETGEETLYADQAEAIFNQHPDVLHTALVGVGDTGRQMPVLCAQLRHKLRPADVERVQFDLLQLAQSYSLTRSVRTVMFHPGFPLDPRNPAVIRRDALSRWAARKMKT
jgi:acyl-CoA synthetase (AMP-forming)/AMP-acid ligase II